MPRCTWVCHRHAWVVTNPGRSHVWHCSLVEKPEYSAAEAGGSAYSITPLLSYSSLTSTWFNRP